MSNTKNVTDANEQQHLLAAKVNLFLFDLKNEATEHGFKPNESWTLELATTAELVQLKKVHQPVITLRLQPQDLLTVFHQVKNKLKQNLSADDMAMNARDITSNEKGYLVAYPQRNIRN